MTLTETLPGWTWVRVKFGLDRPSRLAGHTEHRYRQTNKHNAFYYIDITYLLTYIHTKRQMGRERERDERGTDRQTYRERSHKLAGVLNGQLTGKTGSRVAIISSGITSSTSASGPCFNSPAIMPSECRYVSSLIFCQITQMPSTTFAFYCLKWS